jgi:hypothetical protein
VLFCIPPFLFPFIFFSSCSYQLNVTNKEFWILLPGEMLSLGGHFQFLLLHPILQYFLC